MMECVFGTIALLAVAGTTLAACGVALTLALLPQIVERRQAHERAAFLRVQLLHHLTLLPQYLQERDRSLSLEHRDMLDEFCCLAQHASLLEMEEWTRVLRTQATLTTARNRPSYTKREARFAQQLVDHCTAVLRAHASNGVRKGVWWKYVFPTRNAHSTAIGPAIDTPLKLRDTVG